MDNSQNNNGEGDAEVRIFFFYFRFVFILYTQSYFVIFFHEFISVGNKLFMSSHKYFLFVSTNFRR